MERENNGIEALKTHCSEVQHGADNRHILREKLKDNRHMLRDNRHILREKLKDNRHILRKTLKITDIS